MKTTIVRAFVIALALTGSAATAHTKTTGHAVIAGTSAYPVPLCNPNAPDHCGID